MEAKTNRQTGTRRSGQSCRGVAISEHAICPWQGENVNRRDDTVEARSVEDAVAVLSVKEEVVADAHPERCARL